VIYLEGSAFGRPAEDLRPAWLPHAPRSLFALAAAGYVALCLAGTRWLMVRRRRALTVALAAMVMAIGATVLLVAARGEESGRPVVVIARNGVQLRKGDGPNFLPRYETPVNRGVEARLLYRGDGWLQIELAGDEVGWVAEAEAVAEGDS
jgi:hypothetical protein